MSIETLENSRQHEWLYWGCSKMNQNNALAVSVVLGGSLAAVGVAVAAVAAVLFSAMALGPLGFALAGVVTVTLAIAVPLALISVIKQKFDELVKTGNYERYVLEKENLQDKGQVKHKAEFNEKMRSFLTQVNHSLIESLKNASIEDSKALERAYCDSLDAFFETQFPEPNEELKKRLEIEKILGVAEVKRKFEPPKNKI